MKETERSQEEMPGMYAAELERLSAEVQPVADGLSRMHNSIVASQQASIMAQLEEEAAS